MSNNRVTHRKIESTPIPGQINLVRIFCDEEGKSPIGYALIVADDKMAILWHVNVAQKYRRQKYASNLIDGLKSIYDRIETLWDSEEGRQLCLSNGFKQEMMLFKKQIPKLVWVKDEKSTADKPNTKDEV